MTMTQRNLEIETYEYLLGLEGLGLGPQAARIRQQAERKEIRPLLLRQRQALKRAELIVAKDPRSKTIKLEDGEEPTFGPASTEGLILALEAEAVRLDCELEAAWGRCLEALKVLWLAENRGGIDP